jgi:hypothetical protein
MITRPLKPRNWDRGSTGQGGDQQRDRTKQDDREPEPESDDQPSPAPGPVDEHGVRLGPPLLLER